MGNIPTHPKTALKMVFLGESPLPCEGPGIDAWSVAVESVILDLSSVVRCCVLRSGVGDVAILMIVSCTLLVSHI